jgi:hypothetical protein
MKNVLVIVIPVIHPTAEKENLMILFSTLSNSLVNNDFNYCISLAGV